MEPTQDLNHPSDEQLAAFGDPALGTEAQERLALHLDSCASCQARLEQLEPEYSRIRQYLDAVHVRVTRPSQGDLRMMLRRAMTRSGSSKKHLFPKWQVPKWQVAWAAGIAASLAAWMLFTFWNGQAQEQRAETLLAQASSVPSRVASHRTLRVRTRAASFLRLPASRPQALAAQVGARFLAANYDWNDPLSAQSYTAWRHTLKHKSSKVSAVPASIPAEQQVETTTDDGALRTASLIFDAKLAPVSGLFQFSDREWVEITSLPDTDANSVAGFGPAPVSAPPTPGTNENSPREPLTERELDVRLAINVLHTGASEPIEVSVGSGDILVTAYHLTSEQEATLSRSLNEIGGVRLSTLNTAQEKQAIPADAQGLILHLSQDCSFEAHLLAELAQRFQPSVEATLRESSRSKLSDLRASHVRELNRSLDLLQQKLQEASPDFRPPDVDSAAPPGQGITDLAQAMAAKASAIDRLLITAYASGATKSKGSGAWAQIAVDFAGFRTLAQSYGHSLSDEQHLRK
jgi:hypothetical protein